MLTCTKRYSDLPFAHRQHNHDGHCAFIHGHNWGFEFVFACTQVEKNGFVIDFGSLKWLKEWLNGMFDHTCLLNQDDPYLEYLRDAVGVPQPAFNYPRFLDLRVVPNCGCEGLAAYVFEKVDELLRHRTSNRVFLASVKVIEDEKNSATFAPVIHICEKSHDAHL